MWSSIAALPVLVPVVLACLGYEGGVPTPTAHYSNSAVIEVAAGQVFDAGWAKYDRGSGACNGDSEGDWKDAVFYLHSGATLKNVIIGANQAEGVHCDGPCTLQFVWFEDVCEDAITIVSIKAHIHILDQV
jgi:pectate lyase